MAAAPATMATAWVVTRFENRDSIMRALANMVKLRASNRLTVSSNRMDVERMAERARVWLGRPSVGPDVPVSVLI
jgi:hypothetical protein